MRLQNQLNIPSEAAVNLTEIVLNYEEMLQKLQQFNDGQDIEYILGYFKRAIYISYSNNHSGYRANDNKMQKEDIEIRSINNDWKLIGKTVKNLLRFRATFIIAENINNGELKMFFVDIDTPSNKGDKNFKRRKKAISDFYRTHFNEIWSQLTTEES